MTTIINPFRFAGGHVIEGSAVFNGVDGVLSRTFTSEADHSGSVVFKRSGLGATQRLFGSTLYFDATDHLVIFGLTSTAVFRDPAAWMHLFWNNTGAWINGEVVAGSGSFATAALVNPKIGGDTNFLDGYISLFAFGDNQSWTLSQTGDTDAGGYWEIQSHAFVSTGTDTFKLEGGVDVAAGTDSSGNGNDFTPAGTITVTSDSPTNDQANGYGNFAVVDGLSHYSAATLEDGSLTTRLGGANANSFFSTLMILPGMKVRFEFAPAGNNNSWQPWVGIVTQQGFHDYPQQTDASANMVRGDGSTGTGIAWGAQTDTFGVTGIRKVHDNTLVALIGTLAAGDKVDMYVDMSAETAAGGLLYFGVNGGTPVDTAYALDATVPWLICSVEGSLNASYDGNVHNFGATGFTNVAPVGYADYVALATQNFPAPGAGTTPMTGSFTGNTNVDGPFVYLGFAPDVTGTSTIDGNTITWGTHCEAKATGFKVITTVAGYNEAAANAYSIDVLVTNEGGAIQGSDPASSTSQGRAV